MAATQRRNDFMVVNSSPVVTESAQLRDEFLLEPSVTFLNHGSFGACPRDVFARYQEWQLELEREPVQFITRRLTDLKCEGWPFLERLDTYQEADAYARGIYRRPTNTQMVRFLVRTAVYRLEQKLVSLLEDQWIVAIRPRSDRPATTGTGWSRRCRPMCG